MNFDLFFLKRDYKMVIPIIITQSIITYITCIILLIENKYINFIFKLQIQTLLNIK